MRVNTQAGFRFGCGLVFIAGLLVTGCRDKPGPTAPVGQAHAAGPVQESETGASLAAAQPAAAGAAPGRPNEMSLDIESIEGVLNDYADAFGRVPKDLDEMVRLKLIPRVPPAPPGKVYVIKAEQRQIVLQDKR